MLNSIPFVPCSSPGHRAMPEPLRQCADLEIATAQTSHRTGHIRHERLPWCKLANDDRIAIGLSMRAIGEGTLTQPELAAWKSFHTGRLKELQQTVSPEYEHLLEAYIWDEFIKYKWAVKAGLKCSPSQVIEYAQRMKWDGPDVRSLVRREPIGLHLDVKAGLSNPNKLGPNYAGKYEKIQGGTLYNYFFKTRYDAQRSSGSTLDPKELTANIAEEWNKMTQEQRKALELEKRELERNHQ